MPKSQEGHRFAWTSFCPGRFLGLLAVGLVVGGVVKMFKFTAAAKEAEVRAGVSTKPAHGVLVDLELRA